MEMIFESTSNTPQERLVFSAIVLFTWGKKFAAKIVLHINDDIIRYQYDLCFVVSLLIRAAARGIFLNTDEVIIYRAMT